ncbi:MAG: hypothetical protein JO023_10515 [Chloroflexi bacterium]|nr:hypothetical protein [Chloroflexota bacterium]
MTSPDSRPDRGAVEAWIRTHVDPVAPSELTHQRPWSTVLRVPLADGVIWFKACAAIQAFEPRLTGELYARWPDRVTRVLARDDQRAWLLLADAGTPMHALGNPPSTWLALLPRYAELQRGEVSRAPDHLAHGVPDLRVATWPARYAELLTRDLPLDDHEVARLRGFAPRFGGLCDELAAAAVPASIQHDDLHWMNVYQDGRTLRVVDWGDSSISHPFASLVVTFRFLEEINQLQPDDPWFARLRDAYLEPWGAGLTELFALAMRAGAFAHTFAWLRQRDALPTEALAAFDDGFGIVLRRALRQTVEA